MHFLGPGDLFGELGYSPVNCEQTALLKGMDLIGILLLFKADWVWATLTSLTSPGT